MRTFLTDDLRRSLQAAVVAYALDAQRMATVRAIEQLVERIRSVPENRRGMHHENVLACVDAFMPHLIGSHWRLPFGPVSDALTVEDAFILWASRAFDDDVIGQVLYPGEYKRPGRREFIIRRVAKRRERALIATGTPPTPSR